MKTRIQKWGNSLALRIPKSFAEQAQLEKNSVVELSVVDGKLLIKPLIVSTPTLDELLAGVTEDNIHHEFDTGPSTGKEVW